MREPEWGDPINAYTKWVVAALVTLCVLFVGVGMASAHQSVVSAPGIVTWTHGDHANDPIGVTACIQNQHGLVKCVTHNNVTYQFTAPYPQVPPNPLYPSGSSLLQVLPVAGYEWYWTNHPGYSTTRPPYPATTCVFDWRKYLPQYLSLPTTFYEVACLNKDQTTFFNEGDRSVDGSTVLPNPDPGFIKLDVGTPAPPVPAAPTPVPPRPVAPIPAVNPGPISVPLTSSRGGFVQWLRGFRPLVGTGISAHNIYMAKSRGFMLASASINTGGKRRQVRACLGTGAQPELHCKSALTTGWRVGLAVPCAPKLPFRLWLLRVNGFPVASTYSRC